MIHEFAIEPEAMASSWETFRYLIEKFDIHKGRVIARFPKKWERMVYSAAGKLKPVARKRIEEKLRRSGKRKLISTGRIYDTQTNWLENAFQSHQQKPFRSIVALENSAHDGVLHPDDLDDELPPLAIKREQRIPRTATDIAKTVAPLLGVSKTLLLVDGHFRPQRPKYQAVVKAIINAATQDNHTIVRFEYHCLGGAKKPPTSEFHRHCQFLSELLPKNISLTIIRWDDETVAEDFHARYVLTDIGGIRIDRGLDEGNQGETTDIGLLDHALYLERWRCFQKGQSPYQFIDEKIVTSSST
ncbi:MAG: hypothetical protein HN790_04455 [Methylococcales bacterium]|nr:hypothetical protein [Methylococcales bacterium]